MTSTSPSGVSPADIYYTDFIRPFDPTKPWGMGGSLFATAAQLGLLGDDNLNALDIFSIPEPATLTMLVVVLGA